MSENDIIPIIRKRGRPTGEWKGPKARYVPKKWLPEFNQVVFDYIAVPGVTYEELGKKYGYTAIHIGNIINSPQAKAIQESVANGIIKLNQDNVTVKLSEIAAKSVERIHSFIHDEHLFSVSPFAFIDKTIAIRKSIGIAEVEKDKGGIVNNNTLVISGKDAGELLKSFNLAQGLRKEDEIKVPEKLKVVNG